MTKDLISRLNESPVLCAEGYLFAMERRGYLQAGVFVPEVVLEHPEVVSQLYTDKTLKKLNTDPAKTL